MMIVVLKQCTEEDIPQLTAVSTQSYREHYLYLWTEERYADWYVNRSFSAGSLAEQMSDPDAVFFLVFCNNLAAGFGKLNLNKGPEGTAAESIELERIYLIKGAAGAGAGTEVLRQVILFAKERGKKLIWLKSMDSSPAICFYEKAGFVKGGTERLPFEGLKNEFRNMFLMLLPLT